MDPPIPRVLPVAPSWQSLGSVALHPWAAAGRWAPCPSLQESSGSEDPGMVGGPGFSGWLPGMLQARGGCGRPGRGRKPAGGGSRNRTLPERCNKRQRASLWEGPRRSGRASRTYREEAGTGAGRNRCPGPAVVCNLRSVKARVPSFQTKNVTSSLKGTRQVWGPWTVHPSGRGSCWELLLAGGQSCLSSPPGRLGKEGEAREGDLRCLRLLLGEMASPFLALFALAPVSQGTIYGQEEGGHGCRRGLRPEACPVGLLPLLSVAGG